MESLILCSLLVTYKHHVGLLEVSDADLLGGHDLQEGQQYHRQQGRHWQGYTLCHPVHRLKGSIQRGKEASFRLLPSSG